MAVRGHVSGLCPLRVRVSAGNSQENSYRDQRVLPEQFHLPRLRKKA